MTTKLRYRPISFFSVGLLCMIGCGSAYSSGSSSDSDATSTALTSTLSSIQTNIFTPKCATSSCHSSGAASAGLSLADGAAFASLVGASSQQLSTMNRVTASDTSNSYMIHKLEGTQATAGGTGSTMPFGGTALTTTEIQVLKDWINSGALND
jgi:hypothetical protein